MKPEVFILFGQWRSAENIRELHSQRRATREFLPTGGALKQLSHRSDSLEPRYITPYPGSAGFTQIDEFNWYALLFSLIEHYQKSHLHDSKIDELLSRKRHLNFLREVRNTFIHRPD